LARYWNTWTSLEMSLLPINNHTCPSRPTQIGNMGISELLIDDKQQLKVVVFKMPQTHSNE